MKKNEIRSYFPLSLAMLVPVPGRFAYGIILVALLFSLVSLGMLFKKFASRFFDEDLQNALSLIFVVFWCIFFKQIIILLSPLSALTLGICFFMPAFTPFVLGNVFCKTADSFPGELKSSLFSCGVFSVFSLLFFLIRDVIAYGTISFPCRNGIAQFSIFAPEKIPVVNRLWASFPGAVLLLLLFILLISLVMNNLEIVETSEIFE